jgi:inositol-phosphate phosphatase / L-galactose 1-phosphate phosphatase / histidinol-phosphatase
MQPRPQSFTDFGVYLANAVALPALAEGYEQLVDGLRRNQELRRLVEEQGAGAALSSESAALGSLRKANKELVTAAEKQAEHLMRRAVEERYPDHAIVGEEHGYRPGSERRWVFDPVDGTSAMVRTAIAEAFDVQLPEPRPSFGITVALVSGSEATLGIVTELKAGPGRVAGGHTWVGSVNAPTTCDGAVVAPPAGPTTLGEAQLACTVPEVMFNTPETWSGYQALLDATRDCVTDQNCLGFMRLVQPDGGIDIAYEAGLAYHDAAVLVPILQGGGMAVTDDKGNGLCLEESTIAHEFRVLAAAPALHRAALRKIREGVPREKNRFQPGRSAQLGYVTKFPGPDSQ